jgi:hypothetical protein
MAHCIEEKDLVLSVYGPEWHNKAKVYDMLTKERLQPLLCPIVTLDEVSGRLGDDIIKFEGYKACVADMRERVNADGEPEPMGLVPVGLHKDGYSVIQNTETYDVLEASLANYPHRIVSAGTLGNYRRLFFSVELDDQRLLRGPKGDDYRMYLNAITSHDGTQALQIYDSGTRIVCQNTLDLSLEDKGTFRCKIQHIASAVASIPDLAEFVDAVLAARVEHFQFLEQLANTKITRENARALVYGWKWESADGPEVVTGRWIRPVDTIIEKFVSGKGNDGETLYDLLNGVTEFYSESNVMSSRFGSHMEHKRNFLSCLRSDDKRQELILSGRAAEVAHRETLAKLAAAAPELSPYASN